MALNRQKIESNENEIEDVSKRFSDLTEFDTNAESTVYFASGNKTIAERDKASLRDLAHNAVNLTGYIMHVKGFPQSTEQSFSG